MANGNMYIALSTLLLSFVRCVVAEIPSVDLQPDIKVKTRRLRVSPSPRPRFGGPSPLIIPETRHGRERRFLIFSVCNQTMSILWNCLCVFLLNTLPCWRVREVICQLSCHFLYGLHCMIINYA
ncbi:hypothetical protein GGR53DRAFT_393036 [Hypoxylon sp. FL1150]|nr:hypothetical protein GGR53DRAFT_393036 [Hypoxylon sp. FL1150]